VFQAEFFAGANVANRGVVVAGEAAVAGSGIRFGRFVGAEAQDTFDALEFLADDAVDSLLKSGVGECCYAAVRHFQSPLKADFV
jgi:hypothetical protein